MSDGLEIPERTFHKWRIAVEELFGLSIVNEGRGEYRYYIENADELSNGSLRSWLFNTLSVSTLLQANLGMKEKILLEEIPEGKEYLPVILDSLKNNTVLRMTYKNYWRDEEFTFEVEPYCLKLFRQRWYLVALSSYYKKVWIYALDRIRQLEAMSIRFTYPQDFHPDEYFYGCFGIFTGNGIKIETVQLKASAEQANYLRSLKLHESQVETECNDEYSIFTLDVRPTLDFIQELLCKGDGIEVLSPVWLREKVAGIVKNMWNMYKPLKEKNMMTAEKLMERYKKAREEEKMNGELGLITNLNAQAGGILLVGMNPSGKGDGIIYPYTECRDGFWAPKHEMMGDYDNKCGYIDLLPVRYGRQKKVHIDNDLKNSYHGKLLAHTRDYIEELRPRLIIFANTADYYWGFKKETPWMGYTFKEIESPLEGGRKYWKLFQITGIEPTGVNRNVNKTNLIGTYLLLYRQHKDMVGKAVLPERELRFVDIQTIAQFIDSNWEKTLY